MALSDGLAARRRDDARVDGRAHDVATGQDEVLGQLVDVEVIVFGRASGNGTGPQRAALHGWALELNDSAESTKDASSMFLKVGEDGAPFKDLEPLQEEADFLVGEAVLG